MKAFNDLADFSQEEIKALISLAGRLDANPEPEALKGKGAVATLPESVVAHTRLFSGRNGTTRWRLFRDFARDVNPRHRESGRHRDGRRRGRAHTRSGAGHRVVRRCHWHTRVCGAQESRSMTWPNREFKAMTDLIDTPYINMESAMNHPCQSLADWKTMDDLGIPATGGKFVLSWAYHPRALPLAVPAASLHMAAMRGMDVTVLRPEGFELPEVADAKSRDSGRGGRRFDHRDRRPQRGDAGRARHLRQVLVVNAPLRRPARAIRSCAKSISTGALTSRGSTMRKDDCRFMHCLPVRRGVVVADDILDGPRSVVIPEARNRMLAQMAVLHQMLGRQADDESSESARSSFPR